MDLRYCCYMRYLTKTGMLKRASLLGQIFVLRTSNFRGATISRYSSSTETLYCLNRVFLSRNYRLIFAPRNLMFLKQIFAREANMLFLRIIMKFPKSNYQIDSSETLTLYCLFCSPLNFLVRASSNIGTQGVQELFFCE